MAKAPVAIKTASVLASARPPAPSAAAPHDGPRPGTEWPPIEIQEKAVR